MGAGNSNKSSETILTEFLFIFLKEEFACCLLLFFLGVMFDNTVFLIAVSPTSLSQFKIPGPSMMRSNSIPAQDSSFDLYDDSQLCGSATSLEDRPRAISHSGSFRDSMEEGKGVCTFLNQKV